MNHLTRYLARIAVAGCTLLALSITLACTHTTPNTSDAALQRTLTERDDEQRARDAARHPAQTLRFFRVEPGMTVAEGLPGGGWYTRILANYLGANGTLYGVNYADRMWPLFSWAKPDWIEKRIAANAQFANDVAGYTNNGINADGFTFESIPEQAMGSVDRVLLIRAMHNLFRFEADHQTRTRALAGIHAMLKDDGLVGVVQHRAPENASTASVQGSRGYLKQSDVIAAFQNAGFELVDSSEINANPKDQPGSDAIVWRLPPSLRGTEDGSPEQAAMQAIGESDRMTLLFRKANR